MTCHDGCDGPEGIVMKKFSKHTPEQIVRKLEKIAAIRSSGKSIADACRMVGLSPATFHRWERSYGSMNRQEAQVFGKLQKGKPPA